MLTVRRYGQVAGRVVALQGKRLRIGILERDAMRDADL
jgi:hypothetical protein